MIQSLAVGVLKNFQLHHLWLNFQIGWTFERLLAQIISLSHLINNLLWDFYTLVIRFGLTVVESVHKHVCICRLSDTFSFISSKQSSRTEIKRQKLSRVNGSIKVYKIRAVPATWIVCFKLFSWPLTFEKWSSAGSKSDHIENLDMTPW